MTSHYSRKDTPQKWFLNPNLNIMRMYNLYLEDEEPEVLEREKDNYNIKSKAGKTSYPRKTKAGSGRAPLL